MKLKITGIILILLGCFVLYSAAQAGKKGEITVKKGGAEFSPDRYVRRDDPDFGKEVTYRRIAGVVTIGLGIVCLFVKRGADEEEE